MLGERLDPEVLRNVQERYFGAAATALQRHGGQVEKYIGDAVMCVFGLPRTHEDDALRAARGALDLLAELESLNRELLSELGIELAVRVGINTGEVVAGDHTTGQALVTGDTINTAARLEQAAPAGAILIGAATRRLVAAHAVTVAVSPITAKGKANQLEAWRLVSIGDRREASETSPLVGRARELATLADAFDRVESSCRAELVVVTGEAGIGKSRLVAELVARTPSGRALAGSCPSYGRGNTYRPLRDLIDSLDSGGAVRALEQVLDDSDVLAQRLRRTIGLEAGEVGRLESFEAAAHMLGKLAAERPLIVCFDDLHWAEPTFLDLVEFIRDTVAAPVLLLCTARDELLEVRPDLAAYAMRVGRLAEGEATQLLEELGGSEGGEPAELLARAGGNPLFLRQLTAARREGLEGMPPDLLGLISSRLDALDGEGRAVIEAAAIVGRDILPGAVVPLLDSATASRFMQAFERLLARDFLALGGSEPTPTPTGLSSVFDGVRMHFPHALVHDAVRATMPKARRAELHERFARTLEAGHGVELTLVAYHYEQAVRLRMELRPQDTPQALVTLAASRLERAGMQALDQDDAPAASLLLNRARALVLNLAPELDRIDEALERSRAPRWVSAPDELETGEEPADS